MKKVLILLSVTMLFSGCTVVKIEDQAIDRILDTVLSSSSHLVNQVAEGYKYYLPKGMSKLSKTDYNVHLRYQGESYYLYVDVISYYHKIKESYKENKDAYYSKALSYRGHDGYLEINEAKNAYFVEAMYHYAKIEAYVPKAKLQDALITISYVLSSVQFNDQVIESLIGDNALNYKEESFNIFKPKREVGDFLDYVKEYDNYTKDEDDVHDEDHLDTEIQE